MVRFTKMEGIGNDYVYIDNFAEQLPEERFPALARAVSDRHFGVGSDGLIVLLPATEPGHDIRFRMFNADGSESEMCGNGMRCFARLAYDRGRVQKTRFRVQTGAGTIIPELLLDAAGQVTGVRVDMGVPRLRRSEIPVAGPDAERVINEQVEVDGVAYTFTAVSMGNPHMTVFMDADPDTVDLEKVGPKLEHHPLFPRRINVHFARVLGPGEIKMRTWERGAGITLACGTGASAVLVSAVLLGRTGRTARIHLPGGDLDLEWRESDGHVYKTGPATYVFDGVFRKPF